MYPTKPQVNEQYKAAAIIVGTTIVIQVLAILASFYFLRGHWL
jgi:hypothetical protein